MKTRLIAALLLLIPLGLTRGQTIYFAYDASGNRTSRSITLLKSTRQDNNERQEFKDKLEDQDVLIYPNPVKSELKVEIPGLEEGISASITLFDQSGRLIYQNNQVTVTNILNLADQLPGIYFLNICIGESTTQWKIIKE